MKKRLLITSIVMMLVVAVALSTATYAWFTSNNTVTASTIKMVAATSDADALGIGWITSSAYLGASNAIVADNAGVYNPMVPAALAAGTTTSTVAWSSATIKSVDGAFIFNDDVKTSAGSGVNQILPYTFSNTTSSASAFYVKNLSNANKVNNLRITLDWTAGNTYTDVTAKGFKTGVTYYTYNDGTKEYTEATGLTSFAANTNYYVLDTKNDNLVRVAVFAKTAAVKTTPDSGNYVLKAVLGKEANLLTEWGTVSAGNNVDALCASNAEIKTVTKYDFGALEKNQQVDIVVLVWLDGVALNDDEAGKVSSFGLNFAATTTNA